MSRMVMHVLPLGILVLLLLVPIMQMSAQEGCVGEEECYGLPPISEGAPPLSDWPGDNRLNPIADEYYSIYCEYDLVRIWAGLPSSQEIGSIPIMQILTAPSPFDMGNGFMINHEGDLVTISGSNGNGPAHPGSKSFSLQQCIERNGNPDISWFIPAPHIVSTSTIEIEGVSCLVEVYSDGTSRQTCEHEIESQPRADLSAAACLGLRTREAMAICLNQRVSWNTPGAQFVRFVLQVICQIPLFTFVFLSVPGSVLLRRLKRNSTGT